MTKKKPKPAAKKKHYKLQRRTDIIKARDAFNTPGICGDCGASVPLAFRPEMALPAPNGFIVPGFGKCGCGSSVMSLIGPPQPEGTLEALAAFLDDAFPENQASSAMH